MAIDPWVLIEIPLEPVAFRPEICHGQVLCSARSAGHFARLQRCHAGATHGRNAGGGRPKCWRNPV